MADSFQLEMELKGLLASIGTQVGPEGPPGQRGWSKSNVLELIFVS